MFLPPSVLNYTFIFRNFPCLTCTIYILAPNAIAGVKEHYLQEGFDDYLSKPINTQKLESMLLRYLPDNLIQTAEEPKVEESPISLPELEEFDWDYARRYFANEEQLKQTVRDIYVSMGSVGTPEAGSGADEL